MKIGIFTALFHDRPLEEALDIIADSGIQSVELGGGAYPGSRHLDDMGGTKKLIEDNGARKKLVDAVQSRGPLFCSEAHRAAFERAGVPR